MKKRDFSLDVIRAVAVFFVVCIHFFLYSGFGKYNLQGTSMLFLSLVRPLFITCVPLFLMLTGYLMNRKTYSVKYFFGIRKTLFVYIIATIVCILFKHFSGIREYTFKAAIDGIFDFTGANYAWYIKMYVILFLLFPLFNKIYRLVDAKWYKMTLIGVSLIVGSVIPTLFKGLANSFFDGLYPVPYYFIGAYLSEYGLNFKKRYKLIIIVLTMLTEGILLYADSYGARFRWQNYTYYLSIFTVIIAVMLFTLLKDIDYSKLSEKFKKLIVFVSDVSLGAYLLSYIFDTLFYKYITVADSMKLQILSGPIIILAVFVCSTLCSFAVNKLYELLPQKLPQKQK